MNNTYKYLTYKKEDGTCMDIRVSNEDNECWLTESEIALLYSKDRSSIGKHIRSIIKENKNQNQSLKSLEDPSGQNLPGSPLNSGQNLHIIQENQDKWLHRPPTIYNSKIIIEIGHRIRSDEGLKLKEFLDLQNAIIPINDEEIIVYNNNGTNIDVRFSKNENTVWLTQQQISQILNRNLSVVSRHIRNAINEGEIDEKSNLHFLQFAHSDKPILLYDLDVLISVGYRVKSPEGVAFRRWATKMLRSIMLKGYAINDDALSISEKNYHELKSEVEVIRKDLDEVKDRVYKEPEKEILFYQGHTYDAYAYLSDLFQSAKEEVVVVDRYFDDRGLRFFAKCQKEVKKYVLLSEYAKLDKGDVEAFNKQYGEIIVKETDAFHDRVLIFDKKDIYLLGSSLNYVGLRLTALTKLENEKIKIELLNLIETYL